MGSVGAQLRAEAPGGFGFYFFWFIGAPAEEEGLQNAHRCCSPMVSPTERPILTLRLVLGVLGFTAANHAQRKEIPLGVIIIIYVIPDPFLIHASLREAP